jgi:hypothetical protein
MSLTPASDLTIPKNRITERLRPRLACPLLREIGERDNCASPVRSGWLTTYTPVSPITTNRFGGSATADYCNSRNTETCTAALVGQLTRDITSIEIHTPRKSAATGPYTHTRAALLHTMKERNRTSSSGWLTQRGITRRTPWNIPSLVHRLSASTETFTG